MTAIRWLRRSALQVRRMSAWQLSTRTSHGFYLQEVVVLESLQRDPFKTEALTDTDAALNGGHAGAIASMLQGIFKVNKVDISKALDKNGEPQALKDPYRTTRTGGIAKTSNIGNPNIKDGITMPSAFRDEIAGWGYVSQSPYSYSFYNMPSKSWDSTPEGIVRISDHWNFFSSGSMHMVTDKEVPNNTH